MDAYEEYAKKMRDEHPGDYDKFISLCRKHGASGALAMCQLSSTDLLPILILWAKFYGDAK